MPETIRVALVNDYEIVVEGLRALLQPYDPEIGVVELDVKGKPQRAVDVTRKIIDELETHTRIDEDIFYPAVREGGDEELAELVAEGMEEHHVVKGLIDEVQGVEADDEAFQAKVTVITENVRHHEELILLEGPSQADEQVQQHGEQDGRHHRDQDHRQAPRSTA